MLLHIYVENIIFTSSKSWITLLNYSSMNFLLRISILCIIFLPYKYILCRMVFFSTNINSLKNFFKNLACIFLSLAPLQRQRFCTYETCWSKFVQRWVLYAYYRTLAISYFQLARYLFYDKQTLSVHALTSSGLFCCLKWLLWYLHRTQNLGLFFSKNFERF